ncbi:MAG: fatty acid desaturase [Myxococcota bacterium]
MHPSDRHHAAADHTVRTVRMLTETFGVLGGLCTASAAGWALESPVLIGLSAIAQGFWFQRLYCVGHEGAHGKLWYAHPRRNDLWGQLALLPLLVPLPVFRKIHRFHHGCNRRDVHTSALDVFVVSRATPLARLRAWVVWLLAVFGGGWFVHSVVSIVLFLALPVRLAQRVSPAFAGWSLRDRLVSIGVFALALAGHVALWGLGGTSLWVAVAGAPLAVFAWVYSAQLYVYHYATTLGPEVTLHARRLRSPLASWWLLHLNEHDTHHRRPSVVWYALPEVGEPLPEGFTSNQDVDTFAQGVLHQLRGPTVIEA